MDATEVLTRIDKGVASLQTSYGEHEKRLVAFDEKYTTLNTRLSSIEEKIKNGFGRTGKGLPGVETDTDGKQFSFLRAVLMISTKRWTDPAFKIEAEVLKQTAKAENRQGQSDGEQRDLATITDSLGGYLVPHQYIGQLIELLRAKIVVEQLGATMMPGLVGSPVEIPRQSAGATGYWVGEGSDITNSDQAFGQVTMVPHEAAAVTYISNRLLRMAVPAAETMIRADLAKVIARLIDLAALRGDGASNAPIGIKSTTGILTTAIAAVPSIDDLYNMVYQLEKNNADDGSLGWAFHPRTWNTLRQLKDGEGRYYLNPDPTGPMKGTLLGFPYRTTTQIPITGGAGAASEIYFGNWADLVVGMWGGVELMASQEAGNAFSRNQTYIRIIQEVDFAIRHAASFCVDSTIAA